MATEGARLRILLVSFIADSRRTGMGRWSHETAGALRALGHEPTLWFADRFPRIAATGRLAVLLFPMVLVWAVWRRRQAFDVAVVHEPAGFWYALLRRLLLPQLPALVLMCHNVERRVFRDLLVFAKRNCATLPTSTRLKSPLVRIWQTEGAIRLADHLVCLSECDRAYLTADGRRAPHYVTRLTNGVTDGFSALPRSAPGHRVLFVGGWVDVKGRRVLPKLWEHVRRVLPDATLTLVGTGAPAEVVRNWFAAEDRASLDVEPALSGENEMLRRYAGHDVLLLPSLTEGSPLVILEAMAAGLPIAAAAVGGVPDLLIDREHALLFPPCDSDAGARAVIQLLHDPLYAATLARAARAHSRSFTWMSTAKGLLMAVHATLR